MTTAATTNSEKDVRALIKAWSHAVEQKSGTKIVKDYAPDAVLFDAIPPAKTVGAKAIAAAWDQCFPYFPEKFRSEHKDLVIETSGDLAFVYGLHHFATEEKDHPAGATWMRITLCLKRIEGKWKFLHEHISLPFDPMTGRALYLDDELDTRPADCHEAGEAKNEAKPGPPASPVTPHLVCRNAPDAIAFYVKALGAKEEMRLAAPDGRLMHACISINGAPVMLVDEFPDAGPNCNSSPKTLKGTSVSIHLNVADADAFAARAIKAGAKEIMPVADMFWGDRYGVIEDPFGHRWSIATPKKKMSLDEIREAARAAMSEGGGC